MCFLAKKKFNKSHAAHSVADSPVLSFSISRKPSFIFWLTISERNPLGGHGRILPQIVKFTFWTISRLSPFSCKNPVFNLPGNFTVSRYVLLGTTICNSGWRVRSWKWSVEATQEDDHVDLIIQNYIWNFSRFSLGLNFAQNYQLYKKIV